MHDVIIIGGGPGGSTTASFLSRAGRKVLLLEKESFPRFHIGESLLPYNMPLFEELGVMPAIKEAGFLPKYGAEFALASGNKSNTVGFDRGCFTEHKEAIQVERSRFDKILLDHARGLGAEVRENCAVTSFQADELGVKASTAQGEFSASFLIDASGVWNFTGQKEKCSHYYPEHRKIAIFGHFEGVDLNTEGRPGDTLITRLEEAWFWLIPLSPTRTSVGLVIDVERYKSSGQDKETLFEKTVERSPFLRARMQSAKRVGVLHGMSDFSYRNRRFVSPRLIRVGDAAGFLDPIFSSGVYLAMLSGKEAAKEVDLALRHKATLTRGMKRYEKRLVRYMDVYWRIIERFYTHHFMELLMQPEPVLRLPCAMNAVLAGRVDLPWKIRWRLSALFALGRLQKRWPVVPRLRFG